MPGEVTREEDVRDGEGGITTQVAQRDVGIASLLQLVLQRTKDKTGFH